MKQADFFDTEAQQTLFNEKEVSAPYRADPDKVRAKLHRIIGEARASSTLPWDTQRFRLYRTIVPQMTLWLPDEEAAQLRLDFETEIRRLNAA